MHLTTAQFRSTNGRIIERQKRIDEINSKMNTSLTNGDLEGLKQLIDDLDIACPESGSRNWTEVRQFNLMFSTQLGNIAGGGKQAVPKTGNGTGNLRKLSKCTEDNEAKKFLLELPKLERPLEMK